MKFTWKIGNRLIRKKNQFSDWFRFLFFELWSFLYSNHPNFRWIFTITHKTEIWKLIIKKPENRIIHKNRIKTEGRGEQSWKFLVGTEPNNEATNVSAKATMPVGFKLACGAHSDTHLLFEAHLLPPFFFVLWHLSSCVDPNYWNFVSNNKFSWTVDKASI